MSSPSIVEEEKRTKRPLLRAASMTAQYFPHLRKTKIVATLGPASNDKIGQLIDAGVNVFRINFSHADHEQTTEIIARIRQLAIEKNKFVGILGDLCGPKVRVGVFEDPKGIELKKGDIVKLVYSDQPGRAGVIPTSVKAVIDGLSEKHRVLLDDGKMRLRVVQRISPTELECKVVVGGLLKQKKGINVPDIALGIPALTEKDKFDAKFVFEQKLDFVALSFVQRASDVRDLRVFMNENLPAYLVELTSKMAESKDSKEKKHAIQRMLPKIIAKIEKPQAVDNLDSIIDEVDGIMVARGDLGVECDLPGVPLMQKIIISKTKAKGKPVITATQMLETMIENPTPTRAEVSDVATAVWDGTDAVMLSGETASGKYPEEAVHMMNNICIEAEKDLSFQAKVQEDRPTANSKNKAIADAAVMAANEARAPLFVYSEYGNMVSRVSQRKPSRRIVAVTHEEGVARMLSLWWGVYSVVVPKTNTTDKVLELAEEAVLQEGWLTDGEHVVFVSGAHEALIGLNCTLRLTEFGNALRAKSARSKWVKAYRAVSSQPNESVEESED